MNHNVYTLYVIQQENIIHTHTHTQCFTLIFSAGRKVGWKGWGDGKMFGVHPPLGYILYKKMLQGPELKIQTYYKLDDFPGQGEMTNFCIRESISTP